MSFPRFHPICKDGYPYIAAFGVLSILFAALSWGLGCVLFVITLFCCYFFRDPVRVIPLSNNLIICPADGMVAEVKEGVQMPNAEDAGANFTRVVIFLGVMDVHINRFPVGGEIMSVDYYPGKCPIPSLQSNCGECQRQEILLKSTEGKEFMVVQVSGMLARRLVSYGNSGDKFVAGERLGLIKFGSRVDFYFPAEATVSVEVGRTVVAGETILAYFGDIHSLKYNECRQV